MADDNSLLSLASDLVSTFAAAGKTVATAESCTGGWIAKAITDVAGSSAVFGYGVVSYADEAKASLLGVSPEALVNDGAVSESVVRAMAEGALHLSGADIAVAVSGVAGPDGGSPGKPVGLVWFSWAVRNGDVVRTDARSEQLAGDRDRVREQTVNLALAGLQELA